MAEATVTSRAVKVTLELTEEEALYLYGALNRATPEPLDRFGPDGVDPVYDALWDALTEAGVDPLDGLSYVRR